MGFLIPARGLARLCPKTWRSRRYKSTHLSANEIRQHFIEYFKSSGHTYIRSCPVRPFADPTLEFVNAGMNQFKNVFLGLRAAPAPSATNSQKCIRIGGKHNDLDVVGHDTYHHTFFEMLGNWSFGSYFKKEACEMAWKLITSQPFCLPPDRLYVTYFGGDTDLSLSPDLETKEIWLQIGVSPDRIVPFGLKDNFWEMGLTGPCGPCTEIHYDHIGTLPRPYCVNKGLVDLTELWNLVFIQYERMENGKLTPLAQSFVDTGMGFERLVALLQEKSSNYDTDLFRPIFDEIHRVCKTTPYEGKFGSDDQGKRDTFYRTLADHVRMVTVAVADNIFPYQSHGLRRVLRKSFRVADTLSPGKAADVVVALSKVVTRSLENFYPETAANIKQVEYVIRNEYQVWLQVLACSEKQWNVMVGADPLLHKLSDVLSPGLVGALGELSQKKLTGTLPPDLALILFDRYGLDVQLVEELASIKGLSLDSVELQRKINDLKSTNKRALNATAQKLFTSSVVEFLSNIPPTVDKGRYDYSKAHNGDYIIPEITSDVLAVFCNGVALRDGESVQNGCEMNVVVDRTNCWSSQKGASDVGCMEIVDENEGAIGKVTFHCVSRVGNHIFHQGTFSTSRNGCNFGTWKAKISVDVTNRVALMRNVTASHLIAHVLKKKYVGHLSSFTNSTKGFSMKFVIYDPTASEAGLILLEHSVNQIVKRNSPINVSTISLVELLGNDDISIPHVVNRQGDHFPLLLLTQEEPQIREVSYGPNLLETGDVQELCMTDVVFSRKQREVTFKCVTGPLVDKAYQAASVLLDELRLLNDASTMTELSASIDKAKDLVEQDLIPICFRVELNHLVQGIVKIRKTKLQENTIQSMDDIIDVATSKKLPYLVHFAGEDCKLEKLTKRCENLPVMLFAYNKGHLTARCCTPKECQQEADAWMSEVAQRLGTEPYFFKGHDEKRVCGLRPVKMTKKKLAEVNPQLQTWAKEAFGS